VKFIDECNLFHLTEGLTYTRDDWELLDDLLDKYNEKTGLIANIVERNRLEGFQHKETLPGNQLIFHLDAYLLPDKRSLATADVGLNKKQSNLPPSLHLTLQSPSLNVPQRIEIPLKYILKGLPSLIGTHMVYLHAIRINDGSTFSYYGRTKRGWMKRFMEHVKLAMKGSTRKFPRLYGSAIAARYEQLYGSTPVDGTAVYTGSYHVVCGAGLDKASAIEAERYLIKKYGLNPESGLNMI
jgi:hypothetical protein